MVYQPIIETLGERSAAGLPNDNGALLTEMGTTSLLAKSGLKPGDVILQLDGSAINNIGDLLSAFQAKKWMGKATAIVFRNQGEEKMTVMFK